MRWTTAPPSCWSSEENSDFLLDEFGRYARDYDVRAVRSAAEAATTVKGLYREGRQLALAVSESVLPDDDVLAMFQRLRTYVPTARRLIAAHWTRFRIDAEALRPALAKGKYDAYLLMPRGVRDEEFHTAVCELLSDWGSTVAAPVVESLRIVSPTNDGVTLAVRDYLDRIGVPALVHHPDSEIGREILARLGDETPTYPVVERWDGDALPGQRRCATWRCRSTAGPTTSRSTPWSTWSSSAPARPASPRRCTAPPRASPPSRSRPRRSAARPARAR